jgi:hypothetical protein
MQNKFLLVLVLKSYTKLIRLCELAKNAKLAEVFMRHANAVLQVYYQKNKDI